jgi:biopolymer transport protein TolR
MSMTVGGSSQRAEINVTPMIDVLLVLIIIFMVITPTVPKGLLAALPQPATDNYNPPPGRDVVITVARGPQLHLNEEPIEYAALGQRLATLYRAGSANHIFVSGAHDLEFQEVARVIDVVRGAG